MERLEMKLERRMNELDAKMDKLSWMMCTPIAIANFAKQFL